MTTRLALKYWGATNKKENIGVPPFDLSSFKLPSKASPIMAMGSKLTHLKLDLGFADYEDRLSTRDGSGCEFPPT